MASTTLIPITSDLLFDLNGRKGKSLIGLFDGSLSTSLNLNGVDEDDFVLPFRSFIVLPGVYNNVKIEYYDSFGSGGVFTVNVYGADKTFLDTYALDITSGFNVWQTRDMSATSGIRFIELAMDTHTNLSAGIFEFKVYGDKTADADSIYPGTEVLPRTDPGAAGFGMNFLDDRISQIDVNGDNLAKKLCNFMRVGVEGSRFDIYPGTYDNDLVDSPLNLNRFGTDSLNNRVLNFARANGMKVQFYHVGGSIKQLSSGDAASSNGQYLAGSVNQYKYIEPGADPEDPDSWAGLAELFYKLVCLYGNNADADLSGKTITGGSATPGQGGISIWEIGNEWNKDWQTTTAFHSPLVYYTALRAVYLRAKEADPTAKIYASALTYMDPTYWRAVYFHHFWLYGASEPFPADGFNMNLYMNTALDGQDNQSSSTALSPEAWGFASRLSALKDLFDLIFPNKALILSETGVATATDSPFNVVAIGDKTAGQVAADLSLRISAMAQSIPFLEGVHYYAFYEDTTDAFDTMGATHQQLNGPGGSYTYNTVYSVGYAKANELTMEKDYKWYADIIADGDTTGPYIRVKKHGTDVFKKLFKVWMGTHNGTVHTTPVPVGPNAKTATLYALNYSGYTPTSSNLTISNNNVLVSATEGMQWVEVIYSRPVDTIKIPRYKKLKYKSKT